MTDNTRTIILAAIKSDATITPVMAKAIADTINGKTICGIVSHEPIDRLLSRKQVADIIGVSVKMVDIYGRRGIIRRVSLTGKQAQGYSEESVRSAMRSGSVNVRGSI